MRDSQFNAATIAEQKFYEEFKKMVLDLDFGIEKALKFTTSNVSKALSLYPKKGTIKEGSDADVLIVDDKLEIESVIANGNLMMDKGKILIKGTYE